MFRILYVDDEPALLEIGKIFLEKGGQFSVDIQTSASAGITLLSSAHYDAIVSDYQMPDMDGIEFLKKVRTSGSTIPFILFTGRGREEVVIQALNEGADFYLQKGGQPLAQFTELSHQIRQAIQQRQAEMSIRDHVRKEADIINFLPDATFAIDTRGVVIAWNQAMEMMTGVPASQIMGKGNYEYAIPFYQERRPILIDLILSDDPATEARYPHITREGEKLFSEITILHMNDGGGASLWFTASPLYDTRGVIVGAIESIRDITERKQAEEALRSSEENFRSLVENAPDAIYIATNDRFVYLNTEAVRLFGASSQEELLGTNVFDRIHPSFHELIYQRVMSLPSELKPVVLNEEMYLKMDGTPVDVELSGIPLRYGGEKGVIVFFHDISQRKQAESELRAAYEQITATENELRRQYRELAENNQKLRLSEARYRNVVEVQTELISRFLPDGTHVFVNEAYCRYFGRSREEIIGHTFVPRIPVEDRENVKLHFASLTPSHPVDIIEHRIIMPDGKVRWQRWNDRAIFDGEGNITEFQSVGRDFTERKQAEEALRESEEQYRSLIETTGTGYVILDRGGRVITANQEYVRLTGRSTLAEIEGRPLTDWTAPYDLERNVMEVEQCFRKGQVMGLIIDYKKPDGTIQPIEINASVIQSDSGQIILTLCRDISGHKQAEEALSRVNKKLNLLSSITRHDINNQITMLTGFLSILEEKVPDPTISEYFSKISTIANHISVMIRFTKEYEKIGIQAPVWQDTGTIIGTAANEAPLGKVVVKNDLPPGSEMFADPLIAKVFYNLMENAVQYGGKITTIRFSVQQSGDDHVIVCEDDGVGIPAEEKEKIFDRDFGKNTGMGLFLAREILSITGITIRETGEQGKGARFEMTIPREAYCLADVQ